MTRNIARCALCQDIIESTYRHHFVTCKCGEISLDGGTDYRRALAKDLKNVLELTEDEIAEWDQKPTGRLEEWTFSHGRIWGIIYEDKLKRFRDGTEIRTSTVVSPAKDRKEGRVVETRNSRYLLGKKFKPRKDLITELVDEAEEAGVSAV